MLRTSVPECRGAGQVLQQDFSSGLVFRTDEAQAKQEAAEGIFLIIGGPFGRIDTALIPCHFTQLADKGVIGVHLVRGGSRRKPGEGNLRVRDLQWQVIHTEGFLDKAALGGNERLEVFQVAVGEQALRNGNADGARLVPVISAALVDMSKPSS